MKRETTTSQNLRAASDPTFAKASKKPRRLARDSARPWVCAKGASQRGLPFFRALPSLRPTANKIAAMSA
jgi:hypothetical protein